MNERPEQKSLKCGKWEYDVHITDSGSLMLTVYEPGTTGDDLARDCVIVVVSRDMTIDHY